MDWGAFNPEICIGRIGRGRLASSALVSATSASGTNARTPASMTGYSTGRTPAFETSAPTEGGPTAVVLSPHRCPSARRGHAPSADRYLLLTDGMWATDPELLRRHRSGRRLLSRFWSRAAGQRFGDVAVVRSAARRVGACVRCQLIRDCPYQPLRSRCSGSSALVVPHGGRRPLRPRWASRSVRFRAVAAGRE